MGQEAHRGGEEPGCGAGQESGAKVDSGVMSLKRLLCSERITKTFSNKLFLQKQLFCNFTQNFFEMCVDL